MCPPSAALPSANAPAASQADAPPVILVVDDEPRNVEVLTHLLQAEGYRVESAEDGETALAAAASAAPDVILLDVLMPGPDGYQVCRTLKAQAETVFTPVVLLTALRGVNERIKGAAAGADDFLSKPFDHVELATRVKSLVRVKRLYDREEAHRRDLEQRVAERTADLQRALAQLQELDRLKSEFIANVSHELRTPLQHVKGAISLLADGAMGPLTARLREGLALAQAGLEQLEQVVLNIVDFSRAGDARLEREIVSVPDLCAEAIQHVEASAARAEIRLASEVAAQLRPVRANRAAVTRVLRLLLDNAVKFSAPRQTVWLQAEGLGDRVRFSVRDQGPGIAPETLPHIFDAFYQGDGSTTRPAGGLGVGLAVVRVLLEAHGSSVHVESAVGQGSTFYFDLPVQEDQPG